ncbi:hypothetical protein GNI_052090 [Gregarina niphandrodes]|uniref:Uncharacterized protein n=1 Tax=Gregarina niphandrodes TaxID=110365 RepID=A0A023B971_GRENI|nr:hypothetical protein GNI_052090 [Gregarina niphandrodes]EZG71891.1 hypothetical protein GNI_052090 [Gregarina niphandrodes]|eukprot:XP_011129801.1 hypothetical protein GNI_052090 [Gregarina niphandrodes]
MGAALVAALTDLVDGKPVVANTAGCGTLFVALKKSPYSGSLLGLKVAVPSAESVGSWDASTIAEHCNAVQIVRPTLTSELPPSLAVSDEEAVEFASSLLMAADLQMSENFARSDVQPEAGRTGQVLRDLRDTIFQQWGSEAKNMAAEAVLRMLQRTGSQSMHVYTVEGTPKWVSDVWDPMQESPLWKKGLRFTHRTGLSAHLLAAYTAWVLLEPFLP